MHLVTFGQTTKKELLKDCMLNSQTAEEAEFVEFWWCLVQPKFGFWEAADFLKADKKMAEAFAQQEAEGSEAAAGSQHSFGGGDDDDDGWIGKSS